MSYRELPSDQTVAVLSAEVCDLRRRNKALQSAAVVFAVGLSVAVSLVFIHFMDALSRRMGTAGLVASCACLATVSLFMYFGTVLLLRSLSPRGVGDDASVPPPSDPEDHAESSPPMNPPHLRARPRPSRAALRRLPSGSSIRAAVAMGAVAGAALGVAAAVTAMSPSKRRPGS